MSERQFTSAEMHELDGRTGTIHVVDGQVIFDTEQVVYFIKPTYGYSHRGRSRGSQPAHFDEWKRLSDSGLSCRAIAEATGDSSATINRWLRRTENGMVPS